MLEHLERGADCFCPSCNERAKLHLSEINTRFEEWVTKMEGKYGISHPKQRSSNEDFSDALKEREKLKQRIQAVGDKLSFKQKQFENFDTELQWWCG